METGWEGAVAAAVLEQLLPHFEDLSRRLLSLEKAVAVLSASGRVETELQRDEEALQKAPPSLLREEELVQHTTEEEKTRVARAASLEWRALDELDKQRQDAFQEVPEPSEDDRPFQKHVKELNETVEREDHRQQEQVDHVEAFLHEEDGSWETIQKEAQEMHQAELAFERQQKKDVQAGTQLSELAPSHGGLTHLTASRPAPPDRRRSRKARKDDELVPLQKEAQNSASGPLEDATFLEETEKTDKEALKQRLQAQMGSPMMPVLGDMAALRAG